MFARINGRILIHYFHEATGRVDPRFELPSGLDAGDKMGLDTPLDWCKAVTVDVLRRSGVRMEDLNLV